MPNFWLELFWSSIARYSTRVLCAALTRARRMGVADLSDACGDWMTVGLQLGQMSPTSVVNRRPFLSRRLRPRTFFGVGD